MFDILKKIGVFTMDRETKQLLEEVRDLLIARNEADEAEYEDDKMEEDEELDAKNKCKRAKNKCAKNEDVDKRDLIRQIMAIVGQKEDSEDVRTVAKKAEKLAYDKSEAGTADNEMDEEDEKDEKDDKKKAKNSMDEVLAKFYTEVKSNKSGYISEAEARRIGKERY